MIKKGDLVMVVKPSPCCGNTDPVGMVFEVSGVKINSEAMCIHCCSISYDGRAMTGKSNHSVLLSRLIKIDPPATGDSLPTRKETENEMATN